MNHTHIYWLFDEYEECKYVWRTKRLSERIREHSRKNSNLLFRVLATVDSEMWDEEEKYWIDYYKNKVWMDMTNHTKWWNWRK